eukprot:472906-Ditylum_brightwellii.AAC.1
MAETAQYATGNTGQMFSSASAMQHCQCDCLLLVSAVTVDVAEAALLLLLSQRKGWRDNSASFSFKLGVAGSKDFTGYSL